MDLFIFIIGLSICALTTGVLIYYKMNKNGFENVVAKIVASACFVIFAVLLSSLKTNVAYYGSYAVSFIIIGLVCGLVGDILLEFKGFYPFHEKKYFSTGFITFIIGHTCYLFSLILFAKYDIDIFNINFILPFVLIFFGSLIATIVIWLVLLKGFKFNFKGHSIIINIYSFILIFAAILGFYLSFTITSIMLFILTIGLVFYVFSYYALLNFYYSPNEKTNGLMVTYTLVYYMAQIIVAGFIYFV